MLTENEIQQIKINTQLENMSRTALYKEALRITEILKPFINKTCLLKDGTINKKIKDLISFEEHQLTPLNKGDNIKISFYLDSSQYNLNIKSKICAHGGSYDDKTYYCIYYESNKYVAEIENSILIKINNIEQLPEINITNELKQAQKVETLKTELSIEADKLYYKNRKVIL